MVEQMSLGSELAEVLNSHQDDTPAAEPHVESPAPPVEYKLLALKNTLEVCTVELLRAQQLLWFLIDCCSFCGGGAGDTDGAKRPDR
jgi:hypothetical protein